MKLEGGRYVLNSGRVFDAHRGILGLDLHRGCVSEGYDSRIFESMSKPSDDLLANEPWTATERAEVAIFMARRWLEYGGVKGWTWSNPNDTADYVVRRMSAVAPKRIRETKAVLAQRLAVAECSLTKIQRFNENEVRKAVLSASSAIRSEVVAEERAVGYRSCMLQLMGLGLLDEHLSAAIKENREAPLYGGFAVIQWHGVNIWPPEAFRYQEPAPEKEAIID